MVCLHNLLYEINTVENYSFDDISPKSWPDADFASLEGTINLLFLSNVSLEEGEALQQLWVPQDVDHFYSVTHCVP